MFDSPSGSVDDHRNSPGEPFYKYLPELARRDRENLLANQIITKDSDIERGFEAATRFLFESRLGAKLMEMGAMNTPTVASDLAGVGEQEGTC